MGPALLYLVSSGLAAFGGVFIGAAWMRRRYTGDGHQHAWGQWEECELQDGWHKQGGALLPVLVPGQCRDCLGCGEKQVRMIKARESH